MRRQLIADGLAHFRDGGALMIDESAFPMLVGVANQSRTGTSGTPTIVGWACSPQWGETESLPWHRVIFMFSRSDLANRSAVLIPAFSGTSNSAPRVRWHQQ
jgi:hypothetical protein